MKFRFDATNPLTMPEVPIDADMLRQTKRTLVGTVWTPVAEPPTMRTP